ncbi:hypothetical protein SARC_08292 [Sphaeroforma arctica JP610]|uniref:Heterogeneous nuclear ribonucleoprotein Q acidic domain-containing protein n=1 Tax=Sphaeroforma arctica JP610 TaxID=667725 RepID=A0A0L0FRJ1_9EUKA|nr:hypothetical protein SARC_08292 [Sphaeroforma arctica JP610]KNC79309.1 hypothetical protein SARC_08292 [Sphaeroforma arctica JP610]|eukprot:XP_014153211.1 hypothetical protein SARC_08292 [Sphaeroforma arctica JP610]
MRTRNRSAANDKSEPVAAPEKVEETTEVVNDAVVEEAPVETSATAEEIPAAAEASEQTAQNTTDKGDAETAQADATTETTAAESEIKEEESAESATLKRTRDDTEEAASTDEPEGGKKVLKTNTEEAVPITTAATTTTATITTATTATDKDQNYLGVTAVLNRIYATGKLKPGDVEQGAIDSLKDFPEATAVEIMEKYSLADFESVRNKTGFLIGIIKRYRNNLHTAPPQFGGYGGGPAGPGYGAPTMRNTLAPSTQSMLNQLYSSRITSEVELGDKCLMQLKSYSEDTANQILQKFKEADMKDIRSKSGFLHGIMRRFPMEGGFQGGPAVANPLQTQTAFQLLPWSVQMRISPLYQTGVLLQNDIEARVYESLAQFPEPVALDIASKFCESDLPRVNNKSGWLIGIMKRFRQTAPQGDGYHNGGYGGHGGSGGGYGNSNQYAQGPPQQSVYQSYGQGGSNDYQQGGYGGNSNYQGGQGYSQGNNYY